MWQRRPGFTLIELVLVIGIVALLMTLIMAGLRSAWEHAQQAACMSNLRQLSAAYLAYSADHDSRLLPCDSQTMQAGAPLTDEGPDIPALLPYTQDSRVFHCSKDQRTGVRTYSINDYLGGSFPARTYRHATDLKDVQNAPRTFLFIEENKPLHGPAATGGFVVMPYPSDLWIDAPAPLHGFGKGTCMSFVDGHCEYRPWSDPRTPIVWSKLPYYHTPDNNDLLELQRIEGFGNAPLSTATTQSSQTSTTN